MGAGTILGLYLYCHYCRYRVLEATSATVESLLRSAEPTDGIRRTVSTHDFRGDASQSSFCFKSLGVMLFSQSDAVLALGQKSGLGDQNVKQLLLHMLPTSTNVRFCATAAQQALSIAFGN